MWRPCDDWDKKILHDYCEWTACGWKPENPTGAETLVRYVADAMIEALGEVYPGLQEWLSLALGEEDAI